MLNVHALNKGDLLTHLHQQLFKVENNVIVIVSEYL